VHDLVLTDHTGSNFLPFVMMYWLPSWTCAHLITFVILSRGRYGYQPLPPSWLIHTYAHRFQWCVVRLAVGECIDRLSTRNVLKWVVPPFSFMLYTNPCYNPNFSIPSLTLLYIYNLALSSSTCSLHYITFMKGRYKYQTQGNKWEGLFCSTFLVTPNDLLSSNALIHCCIGYTTLQ
jgi:hypothetical protein